MNYVMIKPFLYTKCDHAYRGYTNFGCEVNRATKFCGANIFFILSMVLASCRSSGARNFEVVSGFLASLCAVDVCCFGRRHDSSTE